MLMLPSRRGCCPCSKSDNNFSNFIPCQSPGVKLLKSTGKDENVSCQLRNEKDIAKAIDDRTQQGKKLGVNKILKMATTQVEVEMITRRMGRSPDFEGADFEIGILNPTFEGAECGVEGGATKGDLVTYTSRARIPTG